MRSRILVFIVFQVVAWTLYFNWEGPANSRNELVSTSEKSWNVVEIQDNGGDGNHEIEMAKLILRYDGLFTKVNSNESVEKGVWIIDHSEPAIILKSPSKIYKYKIVNYSDDGMMMELMNQPEFTRNNNEEDTFLRKKLLSSVP